MLPVEYIGEFLAGCVFLVIGFRLLRLSYRTGESPEWQLGAYFMLAGMSYLAYVLPRMAALSGLDATSIFASRVFYSMAIVLFVQFTRDVYRQHSSWASWLSRCVISLLAIGICGSAATGSWVSEANLWFWFYFAGYTTAIVWMATEAIAAHSTARKRLKIGLCESNTANRYLLWAWFGALHTLACAAELAWETSYTANAQVSSTMDLLLGASEIASIGVVWLAFFAPSFYRRWINRSTESAEPVSSD
jgi:hypothetical protein